MPHIATDMEFASAIGKSPTIAQANIQLLDLAEGLVEDEIGTQDPWPTVAKVAALAAAKRAFINTEDVRQEAVGGASKTYNIPDAETYVYLSENELERLRRWKAENVGSSGKPRYGFPGTWPYPDPVESTADSVTG